MMTMKFFSGSYCRVSSPPQISVQQSRSPQLPRMAALSRFVTIPNACMSSAFHEDLCSGDGVLKWEKQLVAVLGHDG